jgi:hypothetical protein
MAQLNPMNPALAQVIGAMDVISPVTPEGTPTVASQVMQAAQQAMTPQMPNVQDIAQDAGIGNQVQMQQQQAQQQQMMQALQQMMQQRQQQDNAMRFGVAAAPGAQSVRMAEGGIVGYAEGDLTSERLARIAAEEEEARRRGLSRFDPKTSDEVREAMRNRAEAQARLRAQTAAAAPAAEAATARTGLGTLLRTAGAGGMRALGPLGAIAVPLLFGISTRGGNAQIGGDSDSRPGEDASAKALRTPVGATPPAETIDNMATYSQEGRAYPGSVQDRFGIKGLMGGEAGPGPGPGAGGPRMPMPAAPTGPRKSDEYATGMQNILAGYEVDRVKPGDVVTTARERAAAFEPYMREMGVDPRQFEKDLATSEERRARRLQGIEQLEAQSKEARSGMNRLMELLAAGSGRVVPGGIGQQYVNMLRRDLAEDERFMNARERVREAEDQIQMAVRDKRRAEVTGDIKASEDAANRERDARNKKRDAQLDVTKALYAAATKSEEGALDRQHQVAIEQFRASVQRGVNEGLRREQLLRNIDLDRNRFAQGFEKLYRDKVRDLGILNPGNPSPAERQALNKLEAERDAAIAKLEAEAAEARTRIMGGGGGSAIKVEPIKSSK